MSHVSSPALPLSALRGAPDAAIEPPRRRRAADFEWDHEIQIALPRSYHGSDRCYPVLWVTDGSYWFDLAVQTVNVFCQKYVPEMIVVAVGVPTEEHNEYQMRRSYEFTPNPISGFKGFGSALFQREDRNHNERKRALGLPLPRERGGAAAFLRFLTHTLRSELQRDYRMSSEHVLFGDSMGGLFATYALLSAPGSFSRYICGSPYLYAGDSELFHLEERYAQTHEDLQARVFFGAGEAEVAEGGLISAVGIVSSMTRMVEILTLRGYPSLRLSMRIFSGESHESVIPRNLIDGLRAVFTG